MKIDGDIRSMEVDTYSKLMAYRTFILTNFENRQIFVCLATMNTRYLVVIVLQEN